MAKNQLAILLITALLFGCGGNTEGDGSPTLGITSVQKTGTPTPKPSLALNWLNRGLGFMFGEPVMAQAVPPCDPASFAHKIPMADGTIWVTQAYIIIDEIEFNFILDNPSITREFGAFAFDLTNNVDDPFMVPEADILENIIPDNYEVLKVKIGRVDGTPGEEPINLGTNLAAFMEEVFDGSFRGSAVDRRPSFWIKGVIEVNGSGMCSNFKFFADIEEQVPFPFVNQGTINPGSLDVVFFVDIVKAFEQLDDGTFVQGLDGEIGRSSFEGIFLDGRTQFLPVPPPVPPSPNAQALATELFNRFEVFTQPRGSFDGTLAAVPDPA